MLALLDLLQFFCFCHFLFAFLFPSPPFCQCHSTFLFLVLFGLHSRLSSAGASLSAFRFPAFRVFIYCFLPPASPPRRHRRPVPFAHLRRVDSSAPLSFVYQTALSSFSILFLFSFFLSFVFSPFFSFTTTTTTTIVIIIIVIIKINIFFSFTEKVLHYFSEHTFAFHSLLKCNISPLNPRRCSLCCSVVCISALTCACFSVLRVCVWEVSALRLPYPFHRSFDFL
uniref:Uncharacterized protein TCIL3000_11_16730 n=1 Tax=Trypanosoma congolense (strain IL3000) TaxID=1068625 RepID=G0V3D6_TRYCI|nr:unnamed protein product [Trypanosoma congolense IL3000]